MRSLAIIALFALTACGTGKHTSFEVGNGEVETAEFTAFVTALNPSTRLSSNNYQVSSSQMSGIDLTPQMIGFNPEEIRNLGGQVFYTWSDPAASLSVGGAGSNYIQREQDTATLNINFTASNQTRTLAYAFQVEIRFNNETVRVIRLDGDYVEITITP